MPIHIEITTGHGVNRPDLSKNKGPAKTLGPMVFKVALYKDGTWNCRNPLPPNWRYVIPHYASGYWHKDFAGTIVMQDQTKSSTVFEIRKVEKGSGPAFHWLKGNIFEGSGSWRPGEIPSQRMWVGIMAKAGGGLIVGAEGAAAAICSIDRPQTGAVLGIGTGRAGVVGGAAGGLAIVLCIGFNSTQQMDGFRSNGADFSIAIGAKLSGLVKSSKAIAMLQNFEGGLEAIEKAIHLGKESKAMQKVLGEMPGVAKSITSSYGMLVDTDAQNIIGLDIPMAGYGAEIGVFWGWSRTKVLKTW